MQDALATLFERDLNKLIEELQSYPTEESVWQVREGVTNSAGTLALHLTGNLRKFIGDDLGGVSYQRDRDAEFSRRDVLRAELIAGLEAARDVVGSTLRGLSDEQWERVPAQLPPAFPPGTPASTFLLHLYGHLNWHLGQVNYLRRIVTA